MPHHIVIVEDEPVTQARLQSYFTQEGYTVSVTASGAGLREIMQNQPVDLILLDINLPDENGLMLTRALRERSTVGIILVTGRSDRIDRIVGLEMGADDYITKPFSLAVLRARVNTQLRRKAIQETAVCLGKYRFDFQCMEFYAEGRPVELSKTEQKLLRIFIENRGITLSRGSLVDRVWTDGAEYVDENALSVTVKRLRDKLGAKDDIKTVYGKGYMWVKEDE